MKKIVILVIAFVSITIQAQTEKENESKKEYLREKSKLKESFGNKDYYGHYGKLDETNFLSETNSMYEEKVTLLNKYKNRLDVSFFFKESNEIKYKYLIKIKDYEFFHRFVTGNKEFKVSKNYPTSFQNVDLTNEALLVSNNYIYYIEKYIGNVLFNKKDRDNSIDYHLQMLQTIDSLIDNIKIKERLIYHVSTISEGIKQTKKLDKYYEFAKKAMTNKAYISNLNTKYEKLKKISIGSISPNFELKDMFGKIHTLEEYRGKYVYIDIWATWCLPCIKEIPEMQKLEKEFNNIQFISICKNEHASISQWYSMIEEKNLKGVQLYAPDSKIVFFKKLMVKAIPRYILIDKKGRIKEAFALRPSNPKLKTIFNNLK